MSVSNSLSSEMKSKLFLTTKTVGADRIKRAKDNNEDIAVLSSFLPGSAAKEENSRFRCALRYECRLGDPTMAIPGNFINRFSFVAISKIIVLDLFFDILIQLANKMACLVVTLPKQLFIFHRHEEDGV